MRRRWLLLEETKDAKITYSLFHLNIGLKKKNLQTKIADIATELFSLF